MLAKWGGETTAAKLCMLPVMSIRSVMRRISRVGINAELPDLEPPPKRVVCAKTRLASRRFPSPSTNM